MNIWQVTLFMVVAVVAFVGIDVYLAMDNLQGNTYSEILRAFDKRNPWFSLVFCFALGVLVGHWWW